MNPTDITPPVPATPAEAVPATRHGVDETRKLSFWISQLFILLATVMGVYLASSQGFRQALAYGNVQDDKNAYYLRKSLQAEIADNLALVREYMKRLETGGLPARQAPFHLDTFVWENLKYSADTLATPPDLLRESRRFYRGVADLQVKIANNTHSVKAGNEKLQALVDRMEKEVLPKFDQSIEEIRKSLKRRDVEVD